MNRTANFAMVGLLALGTSACGFLSKMMGTVGAGDGAAFVVNMAKYQVESVEMSFDGASTLSCPGQTRSFKVLANGHKLKDPGTPLTLETRAESASVEDSRGKMDLVEFAMGARGGTVSQGSFTADADPFAALMGYDVQAIYRRDDSKQAEVHFDPEYSCIQWVGESGPHGDGGVGGYDGEDGGGAGGAGGPGGPGGPGPVLTAYASIVQTPTYDRVGVIRVTGADEHLTLFDLETGITVSAAGGDGGPGGDGGYGGAGADPEGAGGPGGPGGEGGNGGPGGEVLLIVDDRYPELNRLVRIDVAGGQPGSGGYGGTGGDGGAPADVCDDCDPHDPGPAGPDGPEGRAGAQAGAPGRSDQQIADVTAMFASLPAGVRLRDDPHPIVETPAKRSKRSKSKSRKKKRRRRR
ncbi:MAG: hypothetical protein K0V04_43040 [Deltaproteobacteria bacterium]|nr:hypothetical protein [Deltaproteobacteria bacterium]